VENLKSSVFFKTWNPLGEGEDLLVLDSGLSGDCALHAHMQLLMVEGKRTLLDPVCGVEQQGKLYNK
jgi:hypothetical protein